MDLNQHQKIRSDMDTLYPVEKPKANQGTEKYLTGRIQGSPQGGFFWGGSKLLQIFHKSKVFIIVLPSRLLHASTSENGCVKQKL